MDNDITPVVFRKWTDNDHIIALFPTLPGSTLNRYECESYMHVGQHGAADYVGVIARTVPASPSEYEPLKRELEQIGYKLKGYRRVAHWMRVALQRARDAQRKMVLDK